MRLPVASGEEWLDEELHGEVTLDEQIFCDLVEDEYGKRWGCSGSAYSEDTASRLEANDGVGMFFDAGSLDLAFAGLKKHSKLNTSGIC